LTGIEAPLEPDDLDGLDAATRCWAAKARQSQSLDNVSKAVETAVEAAGKAQSLQLQWEELRVSSS
jgi:hypothetical protein